MSVLSYFEKNDVMKIVKNQGFDPNDFFWSDEEHPTWGDPMKFSTLVWKKDKSIYCLFQLIWHNNANIIYYPQSNSILPKQTRIDTDNWDKSMPIVKEWLCALRQKLCEINV